LELTQRMQKSLPALPLHNTEGKDAFKPIPMITRTLVGSLWAVQTMRSNYDLRKSIFSHAWLDVVAFKEEVRFKVGLSWIY
jgi:hypothetical protein